MPGAAASQGLTAGLSAQIDPAKPNDEKLVYEQPKVDLSSASCSRKRKVLTQADYQVEKAGRPCFDAQTRTLYERIEAKLPGYEIALQSAMLDEDKFIVAAANDRSQGSRSPPRCASSRSSRARAIACCSVTPAACADRVTHHGARAGGASRRRVSITVMEQPFA